MHRREMNVANNEEICEKILQKICIMYGKCCNMWNKEYKVRFGKYRNQNDKPNLIVSSILKRKRWDYESLDWISSSKIRLVFSFI